MMVLTLSNQINFYIFFLKLKHFTFKINMNQDLYNNLRQLIKDLSDRYEP